MASGTITFAASGYLQGKIEWNSVSNGSSANTSTVNATLYARRTNNATTTGQSWSGHVTIGGNAKAISFSSSVSVGNNWVQMVSHQAVISHNDDGTKLITIDGTVTGPSGTSLSGNTSSGSENVWLDTIPRYVTINSWSVSATSETAIKIVFSASDTCDYAWYSKDNGANWTGVDITDASTGLINISSGIAANTTYNVKIKLRRKITPTPSTDLITTSDTKSVTTYNYPYCTDSPNFTIGNLVTLSFYNPLGRTFTFYIIANGTEIDNHWTISGTSYTGIDASSSQNQLYATIPNAQSATYQVKVVYGSVTKTRNNGNTFRIKGNETPIFSNFTYQDTNSTTIALTGNNQTLVKGYSNVKTIISTSNKATPQNSSSIKTYKTTIGTKSASANYSSSAEVNMTINGADNATISVSATDSRGLSTTVSKTATIKNYTPITISNVTATRSNNGVGQAVTLAFNGTIWNSSFGSQSNAISLIKYWYKETTSSTWIEGQTTLTATISGNSWSGSVSIKGDLGAEGFNISKSFDILFRVKDKLVQKDFSVLLTSGTPALAIYKNKVAVGGKYDTSLGGMLQIHGNITEKNGEWTSLSVSSTYFNSGNVRYKRMGSLVFVHATDLQLKVNITNEDDNYATIASGLPNSISTESAVLARYNDDKIMRVSVTTTGILRFHWTGNVTASSQGFEGHFFYITNP